jgi:hypothetical protein
MGALRLWLRLSKELKMKNKWLPKTAVGNKAN